ncbi:Transcriptional Regulator, MarR family protein [Stappia aggregata IAM 12614]|uniref:Transcriptional Regulator, MarR family protein n=1 Tax=Roseibium aggregatum (strain ATCC 25650 / DSM 13394 / JCM 20685 / NBRC 16684 / NCIMB 2208 / IAM 12614 / B1) TaxID=384765 RepID=A0NLE5_ROSAI|nr:MarR family winged helix-turn-helix transcriptional regulator [Roseibium aggregatum]EAV45890.1 Transcriptional Regulator, MarR family protein [Stappia aggregata IAM 12614] [Roseibium aggregatum IAM 12614]
MEEDDFSLCVLDNARKAARAVSRHYDKLARRVGMTPGQFSVLVTIHKYEDATTAELAERLSMDRTTLVRNVALLERKGLVVSQLVQDGRSKQYRLSPKGAELLNKALPLWRRAQADVKDHLGSDEFLRAIDTLKRLSEL